MGLFSRSSKAEVNLEQYLRGVVGQYCEEIPEEQKNNLLNRITDDKGNKKYAKRKLRLFGGKKYRISDKFGQKVYELKELTDLPDWQSDKDFPAEKAYPIGSKEHEEGVKKIDDLIDKFTSNGSKVANDLKNLLANSEIHYRVRKGTAPNGNCSFKKGKNGAKNQIVICIYDINNSEYKDTALPEVLAHELGHALDFSQRPEALRRKYMDGCETTADLIGASLLANAGVFSKGFSRFMGKDCKDKKKRNQDTRMFYSPDGKYRRENFVLAYKYAYKAKRNNIKSTKNNKIKELRGLKEVKVPYKAQPISRENLQGLRYVPNRNNGGR